MTKRPISLEGSREIPSWPLKMTRAERREVSERRKAFDVAVRKACKGSAWRTRDGCLFREKNDWFFDLSPSLGFQSGVVIRRSCKPMSADPVYWEVMGEPDLSDAPLSYRLNGVLTLRPPIETIYLAEEERDIDALADLTLQYGQAWDLPRQATNIERLRAIERASDRPDFEDAGSPLKICTLLADGKFDQAGDLLRASRSRPPRGITVTVISFPSATSTRDFPRLALDWMERARAK